MRKVLSIILILMLCVALPACGGGGNTEEPAEGYSVSDELTAMSDAFMAAADAEVAYNIALELANNEEFHNSSWGDRTAGSRAEHAAADWLVSQMNDIGLTDVQKEGADCDLWQFNDASFQIEGDSKVITPHSYATAATPEGGITAEVIYVGYGTKYDYEGVDAEGKIVLVDVNQRDEWWITYPMLEAQFQGALAIMSAQDGGFSEISGDALNAQDICAPTGIPCVSISANDSQYIREKLEAGPVNATLMVDNEVVLDGGTTYNVTGKIEGKSSENRIIVGGHYDMHFKAFQDDSCAAGLVFAMAKAMIDSGYVPENDIVFCLHGSEEWGSSNTQYDWCTGAWEMINTLHPEWQETTLAFINFELPAYEFATYTSTVSALEMYSMLDFYKNTYPLSPEPAGCFPGGVLTDGYQTYTYSDDFSYYAAGVPSTVNGFLLDKDGEDVFPFYRDIYHSNFDTEETYNESVMDFNLKYYGGLAMYIDQTPALYLDFTTQFDRLSAALDGDIAAEFNADADAYTAALAEMNTSAETLKEAVIALNEEYNQAKITGADEETISDIRARGKLLTDKNLKIFNFAQDAFLSLMYEMPVVPHEAPQNNISWMKSAVEALEAGDVETAFEFAYTVNNFLEYYAMNFSPEVIEVETNMFWGEDNQDNLYWGTGRAFVKAQVNDASRGIMDKLEVENADFTDEIAIYNREIIAQGGVFTELVEREIEDINAITAMLAE